MICLLKFLYWEAWKQSGKNKFLSCDECYCRNDCKDRKNEAVIDDEIIEV